MIYIMYHYSNKFKNGKSGVNDLNRFVCQCCNNNKYILMWQKCDNWSRNECVLHFSDLDPSTKAMLPCFSRKSTKNPLCFSNLVYFAKCRHVIAKWVDSRFSCLILWILFSALQRQCKQLLNSGMNLCFCVSFCTIVWFSIKRRANPSPQ